MFDIDAFQERLDEETFRVGGVEYQRARLGHALRMKLADIERRALEDFDADADKPFSVAVERAALTARIQALKAELADLKARR